MPAADAALEPGPDAPRVDEVIGPPVPLLVLAGFAVLLSAALIPLSSLPAGIVGYLLGSVVTVLLVGLFHRVDVQRRQRAQYRGTDALVRYAGIIAAIGIAVAAVHTWSIATELAK